MQQGVRRMKLVLYRKKTWHTGPFGVLSAALGTSFRNAPLKEDRVSLSKPCYFIIKFRYLFLVYLVVKTGEIGDWVKEKGKSCLRDTDTSQASYIWTHESSAKTETTTESEVITPWKSCELPHWCIRKEELVLPWASHFRREIGIDSLELRVFQVSEFEIHPKSNTLSDNGVWLFTDCAV